jgi:hypothetical protein
VKTFQDHQTAAAEILSKPRLEIGSCCVIERPPRRAQDVVYDSGSLGGVPFGHVRPLSLELFVLLACRAFAVELYRRLTASSGAGMRMT